MQRAKKFLSVLLAVVMMLSLLPVSRWTASAVTGSEIVTYARQFIGTPYDYGVWNPPYSFDCSGLVRYVFLHFGIDLPWSSGTIWNNPTAYGTIIAENTTNGAVAGDVISWNGHVGIYTENGYFVSGQNYDLGVAECPVWWFESSGSYRILRIYGVSSVTIPPAPTITLDKTTLGINETATLRWTECSGATGYWVTCWNGPDHIISEEGYSFIRSLSFSTPGNYSVTVVSYNSAGEATGNWVNFTVIGSCTATFDANGGNCATSSKTVSFHSPYGTLPTPTRPGYTFTGWYTAASGGTQVTENTTVTTASAHTLYAHWSANTLTIYYDCFGSSPTIDTSKGFYFGDYNRICTTTYANQTAWDTENVYYETLEFDRQMGTKGLVDFAIFGLTAPAGYTFAGWKSGDNGQLLNETTRYSATDLTDENLDGDCDVWLTAKFTVNQYHVSFDANGGSCSISGWMYTYNQSYKSLPTPTREHYTFTGWYTAASGGTQVTEDSIVETAADHTLYAHWKGETHTVYFNPNGGRCSTDQKTVTYGSTYGNFLIGLPEARRDGYDFDGWYTAATGGTEILYSTRVTITADQTLYAHWTAETYTLRFNANGGVCSTESKQVTFDAAYGDLPTATRSGYTFSGWFMSADGGAEVTPTSTVTRAYTHTVYAHWTPNAYTVYFDVNHDGVRPNLFSPLEAQKMFSTLEYAYNPADNIVSVNGTCEGVIELSNIPFYPTAGDTYLLSADVLSGTIDGSACLVLEALDHDGERLFFDIRDTDVGKLWTITPSLAKTITYLNFRIWCRTGESSTFSDLTVKIKMEEVPAGTLQVSPFSPNAKRVTYASVYGTLPTVERDRYSFVGWFTADGTEITAESVYTLTEDHTLYAHWEELPQIAVPDGATTVIDEDSGFIYGLRLSPTERILNESYLSASGGATIEYRTAGYIGTGTQVDVLDETGGVVQTYTIVIFGDADGDGMVSQSDIAALKAHMSGADILPDDDPRLLAADADGDGVITLMDIATLKGMMNGSVELDQATRKTD